MTSFTSNGIAGSRHALFFQVFVRLALATMLIASAGTAAATVPVEQLGYVMVNGSPIAIGGSYSYTKSAASAWVLTRHKSDVVEGSFWVTATLPVAPWVISWYQVCVYYPHPNNPHCGPGPWSEQRTDSAFCLGDLSVGCAWVYNYDWRPDGQVGCPTNSVAGPSGCQCKAGYQEDPDQTTCIAAAAEPEAGGMCHAAGARIANPIIPVSREKYRSELDLVDRGPSPLNFGRIYRSTWSLDFARAFGPLGKSWMHSHEAILKADAGLVVITNAEGHVRTFVQATGASNWSATNSADTLEQLAGGGWAYRRRDDTILTFSAAGKLQTSTARNGWVTAYTYNTAGRLAAIGNGFGRTLLLTYNAAGQLSTVTASDGRLIEYAYDAASRLSTVTYPGGKRRTFVYENLAFPNALTGIVDESSVRWGTFTYDTQGRAVTTELAGAVDRYQVSYPSEDAATVLDPLGTSRNYSYGVTKGKLAVTGGSLASSTGESDAASRVQDANGLITSETDFKGVKTETTWDVARRLPLSVTRASGTPEAQTVTTQWHATFSLPVLVTEAGRTTAYSYDDKGNVLSQAITDTGSSPNITRTTQRTWNTQGLAATETAPNGAVTTFEYDPLGNLVKSTNALGHETLYSYDSANRVISTTAPNGVVTTYTWDARDRLLTKTVGGQWTTTLTYKPTGLLETLTLPTGLVLTYSYDAAHRLTGWSNTRGESGSYTLDAMGNRTAEQIKDSAGAVAWTAARTINNLNRLSARTDGPNQTNTFAYDANGELVAETNGLNQSTQYGLDPLRRTKAITNAANATATLAYNALDAVTHHLHLGCPRPPAHQDRRRPVDHHPDLQANGPSRDADPAHRLGADLFV